MIKLIFKSPSELNSLSSASKLSPTEWKFKSQDGEVLELDTENWQILYSGSSTKIDKWVVDESNYTMDLKENNPNLKDLDYAFAVSMIGQLVDRTKLIEYLKSLGEVYNMKPDDSSENPMDGQDESEKDTSETNKE